MDLPVRLTAVQREIVAERYPELAPSLCLDSKGQRTVSLDVDTVAKLAEEAMVWWDDESGSRRNSCWHISEACKKALAKHQTVSRVYQFKITLIGSKPPIWRRIQVKDGTLDDLHGHIQTAMGWENAHLHQFVIKRKRFGNPEFLDDGFGDTTISDSTETMLSDVLPKSGKAFSFHYEYDFGDGWEHGVQFEGCPATDTKVHYPVCIEGERACPPEDIGGVGGFYDFLDILQDPTHEDYEFYAEWGSDYDPEAFDAKKATAAMRRGLPRWR